MNKYIIKFLILFLAITGAVSLFLNSIQSIEFGTQNFWDSRGVFFLFFITLFPRLTLLFSSVPFGGFLWWLGFFFAPRILVAMLATITYWNVNPILVTFSWLFAIGGEPFEKSVFRKRIFIRRGFPPPNTDPSRFSGKKAFQSRTIIDVESQVK